MIDYPEMLAEAKRLKSSVSIPAVIGETLPLKRDGHHLTALCPFHNEQNPSFIVYSDHYYCFGCGAHGDVIQWLMAARRMTFRAAVRYLAGNDRPDQRLHCSPTPRKPTPSRTAEVFLRCWGQGVDPAGTLVEAYLRSRGGLTIPDGAPIRFHPRCQRGARGILGGPEYWPAMIALMTDPISGRPVGLHRTYLLPDGSAKAPVTARGDVVLRPKMIIGTWGVVRLVPDEDVGRALGIAEGIENALTAMQIIGWGPTWAAGTQDGIRRFPVPQWLESVSIFADADDNGIGVRSARACAQRWHAAGREVLIHVPPQGRDWNEVSQALRT